MVDHRKTPRVRRFKDGKILLGSLELPCTIRDLSEIGACLEVHATRGIPAVFRLAMPNRMIKTCKVMWRDYTKLGVHFRPALIGNPNAQVKFEQAFAYRTV